MYPQEVLGREPQGELGIDPQGFLGMDEPPSRLGWVDLHEVFGWKAKGSSDESIGEPLKQACGSLNETALAEAAVNQHHCPSGCPSQKSPSDMEAKTSSHVGFGKHGRDGESPGDDANRDRDGPWNTPKFLVAPAVKGQDQWNCLDYKDKQYWVKVHHAPRLKAFHPLHRNQPFDSETLGKSRVTVKFFAWNHTMPQKTFDNWTSRGEKHDVLPRGELGGSATRSLRSTRRRRPYGRILLSHKASGIKGDMKMKKVLIVEEKVVERGLGRTMERRKDSTKLQGWRLRPRLWWTSRK